VFADSVRPVYDAGLVELVETDHRIDETVSLIPTIGHTPGHVSVRIRSRGQEALITGDFVHHPCQIARPEWASTADSDPVVARHTRELMLAGLAHTPVLVIGTHFAAPTAGLKGWVTINGGQSKVSWVISSLGRPGERPDPKKPTACEG
jgi:glyoxylase-like metal-dependent hydrolase (beta-lactamase superfamily II)